MRMKEKINQKLIETGEKERLKELLRTQLIECGWRDELKVHAKEIVKERGIENVTVDNLIAEVTPKARASVPDAVKKDLLQRIRTFLSQQPGL
ncbi:PREDICTED: transcription and mRNA export factor ENY2-like isoform X2 [Priapulus caudatus]|nr:PREDICTED: transcription and mRNA export factor ENY2-like isoform X2 [Priapulus caudatus]